MALQMARLRLAARRLRGLAGAALGAGLVATLLMSLAACAPSRTASHNAAGHSVARPAQAARLGPVDPARVLSLSFPLARRAPDALTALLAAIADPHSPRYRQYLTAAQYDAAFAPGQAERERAVAALQALGLRVTDAGAESGLVEAEAPVSRIEAAFGVRLYEYRAADGARYVAADGVARLPGALAAVVTGVVGLDTRPVVRRHAPSRPALAAGGGGLDPSALRAVYDVTPLTAKGLDGSGQTVALAEIDQYRQSDIALYDSAFALGAPAPQVISVAGGSRSASPEPALDIEILNAIAPKAQLLVYESGSDLQSLARMFDRMISDNRAQIISISLGACEIGLDPASARGFLSALDADFQRAGAQGMSVLVASGDSGAYGCQDNHLAVDLPGSSPYVTSVGGTALFPAATGGYGSEYGWEGPLEGAGGGGGVSAIYRRPSWQTGSGVDNAYSNGMRQTPDVAADADPLTGYRIYYSGGGGCSGQDCWTVVGGTSAAAPFWAALIALANQAGNRRLGFLNPALYAIGQAGGAPFHDITGGGNLYYQATPGWDYTSGWGSPDAAALVPALLAR